jgi:hypothetical protein
MFAERDGDEFLAHVIPAWLPVRWLVQMRMGHLSHPPYLSPKQPRPASLQRRWTCRFARLSARSPSPLICREAQLVATGVEHNEVVGKGCGPLQLAQDAVELNGIEPEIGAAGILQIDWDQIVFTVLWMGNPVARIVEKTDRIGRAWARRS